LRQFGLGSFLAKCYSFPCGIQNKQVTSLQAELGHPVDFNIVKRIVKEKFGEVFGLVV
jgi:lipoyl(octanoyl) transferase